MVNSKPTRLLHVDDDYETLEAAKLNLRRRGYEVMSASSANEALVFVRDHDFDVVLLDIYMPGTDGIELLRHLREIRPELVTIMLTGAEGSDELFDSVLSGCDGYLEKPCSPDELDSLIKHCLKQAGG